jgi:hypothetical protein
VIASPPPVHPWPIGAGPRYQPSAYHAPVAAGRPVAGMRCGSGGRSFAVHLELFADRRVVIVPRGIGVSRRGCRYPLRTDAPTGVVLVDAAKPHTLGDLFVLWGRKLGPGRLLSFRRRVSVFVDGRRFRGNPRAVRLTRHRQIVVEAGGYVAPHPSYLFPKGTG